ncbi:MAG: hypothetical protein SGPRY_004422 [Prymnesium sp.]
MYVSLSATEALEEAESEASTALGALEEAIRALKAEPEGMAHLLSVCSQQLATSQQLLRAFEVEVRAAKLPPDEADRAKSACKQQRARLASLSRTFEFERQAWQRGKLLKGVGESPIGKARDVETDADLLTPQMIIARGEAIQQESHASVTRMQQMVENTKAIGQDTMVTLGVQRERLVRLRDTAGAMKAQMDMAEREIRSFTTRVFEDNLTLALLILIAVGLTGICYKASIDNNLQACRLVGRVTSDIPIV